jgi:hypothetical protein
MKTHLRLTIDLAIPLPDDSEPTTLAECVALLPAAKRTRAIALRDALVACKPDGVHLSEWEPLRIAWHVCHGHTGEPGSCRAGGEL